MHNNDQERHTASEKYEPVREAAAKSSQDDTAYGNRNDEAQQQGYRFDAFMRIIRD